MNGYKFKTELSAWVVKTSLCTVTAMIAIRTFFTPVDAIKYYPLSWRLVAENEWVFPVGLLIGAGILWLCYWKTISILRADKRYGDR
jgi:hypothetical protein